MSRKIFYFLLSVFILLSLASPPAAALGYDAETARRSAVTEETVVDVAGLTENSEVNAAVWYGIYDPEGLVKFANLVNTTDRFRMKNFRVCLCASIDMTGCAFTPIGNGMAKYKQRTPDASFNGTFDGRGYVIDNLTVTPVENDTTGVAYVSLFGSVGMTARIRNVVFGSGCRFTYSGSLEGSCAASLASRVAEGAGIEQILNLAPVSGAAACGGIVARVEGAWADSDARTADQSPAVIRDCTNRGPVSGSDAVGGILGQARGNTEIVGCVSTGGLTGPVVGGAIGRATQSVAKDGAQDVAVTLSSIRASGPALVGNTGNSTTVTPTDCTLTEDPETSPETEEERLGVRFHGVQIQTDASDLVSVRFIASVDAETTYTAAGFRLTAQDSDPVLFPCTVLFTSLLGNVDGETVTYTVEQLRGADGYLFAGTLKGAKIPTDGEIVLSVSAYAVSAGGTVETAVHFLTLKNTEGGCTVTWENS